MKGKVGGVLDQLFDFTDKVVLVTGGSRGLGRAMVLAFAERGADAVITSRKQDNCERVAEEVSAMGRQALPHACHVGHWEEVDALVDAAYERFGKVDVLVNNAGVMVLGKTLLDIMPDEWDQSVDTNLKGTYLCCRTVVPTMIEHGRGSIINIGSRMGSDPEQGGGVLYSSAKAAVHMFSYCLAREIHEHNIAVNILSPGGLKTEGSAAIPWTQRDWEQRVEPEAVGPSAVFLALQDASSMTGQYLLRAEFGDTWGK